MNHYAVYIRTLLFCAVLIVSFVICQFVFQLQEGLSVLLSLVAALGSEWLYARRTS
ncbi:hypothetical protein SAMN05192534_11825 [Alteribacillus persepolensis]|uniref:Uncharacterized protein n=1 Tax=Alteribacillus persepolensis TaxID=568899 RepID=A0A1G8H2M2_9BACI|nr:hypothetical protein [Alteribacillus persepolensis]SDI00877.1 hypothetical protein SAMN05192534_11825 [Alteribacillus persepolensis]